MRFLYIMMLTLSLSLLFLGCDSNSNGDDVSYPAQMGNWQLNSPDHAEWTGDAANSTSDYRIEINREETPYWKEENAEMAWLSTMFTITFEDLTGTDPDEIGEFRLSFYPDGEVEEDLYEDELELNDEIARVRLRFNSMGIDEIKPLNNGYSAVGHYRYRMWRCSVYPSIEPPDVQNTFQFNAYDLDVLDAGFADDWDELYLLHRYEIDAEGYLDILQQMICE